MIDEANAYKLAHRLLSTGKDNFNAVTKMNNYIYLKQERMLVPRVPRDNIIII